MSALLGGPGLVHPLAHDLRVHHEKGLADGADESEIARPIAAVEIVEEDAAGAARLAAMRQIKVFVAPFLEAGIGVRLITVAGPGERGVE